MSSFTVTGGLDKLDQPDPDYFQPTDLMVVSL